MKSPERIGKTDREHGQGLDFRRQWPDNFNAGDVKQLKQPHPQIRDLSRHCITFAVADQGSPALAGNFPCGEASIQKISPVSCTSYIAGTITSVCPLATSDLLTIPDIVIPLMKVFKNRAAVGFNTLTPIACGIVMKGSTITSNAGCSAAAFCIA